MLQKIKSLFKRKNRDNQAESVQRKSIVSIISESLQVPANLGKKICLPPYLTLKLKRYLGGSWKVYKRRKSERDEIDCEDRFSVLVEQYKLQDVDSDQTR